MRVRQPRLSRERLEIGLAHAGKMFHTDRDLASERRIASVVSLSLVGAGRRKTKAILVRHVVDAVKTNLAAVVVEFRNRSELIAAGAGDQSPNLAGASFKRGRAREGQGRRFLPIGYENEVRLQLARHVNCAK